MYNTEEMFLEEPIGLLIKSLREKAGISQNRLSQLSGIDRAYISQLEGGKTVSISLRTARALANGLGVPADVFLKEEGITEGEVKKELPEQILERLRLAQPVAIPVYKEFPVHAGTPIDPIDYIYIERSKVAKKNIEAYIISGNCLDPDISDGDVIIVDRDASIEHGDIAACLTEDRIVVGRLNKVGDDYWIQNSEFGIKFEDCRVSAKVIQVNKHFA